MTELLCKLFVKDRENIRSPEVRRSYGTLASVVGIIVNILLAAGKIAVGLLFGAISFPVFGADQITCCLLCIGGNTKRVGTHIGD